jgi:hypothetical protein
MTAVDEILWDSVGTTAPLALLLFGLILLLMRRRFVHLLEPCVLQFFLLSFAFAGFIPLYQANDYAWWVTFLGVILALAPFLLLYRKGFTIQPEIIEQRKALALSLEIRVLIVVITCCILFQAFSILRQTGFSIGLTVAPALISGASGPLVYITQAAFPLMPGLLLLTFRTRWFPIVLVGILLNGMMAILLSSRAGFLWPILSIGAALFLYQLDKNTAYGWTSRPILNVRNTLFGSAGIMAVAGLVTLTAMLAQLDPILFLQAFSLRFFNTFDGIFLAVQGALITPNQRPEYSVLISYTQVIHKALKIDVGQVFNSVGEYIAFYFYHFDIWKNPAMTKMALPNSNMVLEFVLSFSMPVALSLIPIYSTGITLLMNFLERHRYSSFFCFAFSQYFLMNSVQYFTDGNSFVISLYGLAALFVVVKILSFCVRLMTVELGLKPA